MKALHITFRYGRDVYGGAEYHMRKVTEELYKKGLDIDICTTRTNNIRPLNNYGVLWDNTMENENINSINVFRFNVKNPNRYISIIFEKLVQREVIKASNPKKVKLMEDIYRLFNEKGGILLDGWYEPETDVSSTKRWSSKRANVLINDSQINFILIKILNNKRYNTKIHINSGNFQHTINVTRSDDLQTITATLPNISGKVYLTFEVDKTERYPGDPRNLGIKIHEIKYLTNEKDVSVDLNNDYRKLPIYKIYYIDKLISNAYSRNLIYSRLFDYLRGPSSPEMKSWLDHNIQSYDVVMAQMFPFNTIGYSMIAKNKGVNLALLPLMHTDDAFYNWRHYYDYLKKADVIFANSKFSKANFFDKIGVNSIYVGAGIDKNVFMKAGNKGDAFKRKYGLENKDIILTVSRKQQIKRYDLLIKAIERVRMTFKNAHLVMIGPEEDNIPIKSTDVSYLGKVSDEDLVNAYDACDAFAMMSESESFGMVFCEAWSRKKPVIGNKNCGAVSTLIDDGIDGFLCSNVDEISDRIGVLLSDRECSRSMGRNGFNKVLENYTWDIIADKIYNCYRNLGN